MIHIITSLLFGYVSILLMQMMHILEPCDIHCIEIISLIRFNMPIAQSCFLYILLIETNTKQKPPGAGHRLLQANSLLSIGTVWRRETYFKEADVV